MIRQRVAFQHCMIDGRTAGEFEPDGAAAKEIADLYADMLTQCGADIPTRQKTNMAKS